MYWKNKEQLINSFVLKHICSKAARAAEAYLKKRLDELTGIEETFSEMLKQKETERLELQDEVERLQDEVEMLRVEAENEEVEKLEAQEPER